MKCDHCRDRMAVVGRLCWECRDDLIRAVNLASVPNYGLYERRCRPLSNAPPRSWRSGFTAWLKGCFT